MQGERLLSVTGRRILSPVMAVVPNLTKRYSIYEPSGRQGIVSAGLISTRRATILAPPFILSE